MDLSKVFEEFVGSGKIQSISLTSNKEGMWIYKYREGRCVSEIVHEDRVFLEKMHMEFGGKNPETCRAPDMFLKVDGSWSSEDILQLGHRPQKIRIKGHRTIRDRAVNIVLPKGTGHKQLSSTGKERSSDMIKHIMKDYENATITRVFKDVNEFDAFINFILNHEILRELSWSSELVGTETKATGDQCVWKRLKAGDGTQRMVLELVGLNGEKYTNCFRDDVFRAADDMFYAPCSRITMKKSAAYHKDICLFAAEDGSVDIDGYESA